MQAASSGMSAFPGKARGQLPPGVTDGHNRRAKLLPATPALPCRFSLDVKAALSLVPSVLEARKLHPPGAVPLKPTQDRPATLFSPADAVLTPSEVL